MSPLKPYAVKFWSFKLKVEATKEFPVVKLAIKAVSLIQMIYVLTGKANVWYITHN